MSKLTYTLSVFLSRHVSLASYAMVVDSFRMANAVLGLERFRVARVSQNGQTVVHPDGALKVDGGLELLTASDVVIVPSLWVPGAAALRESRAFVDALKQLPEQTLLVSLCSGAYLLAASGRLDERQATTHWLLADAFQRAFPRVAIRPDANLVHDGSLICSGGAMAALDACLYLVQLLAGRRATKQLARVLVTEISRGPQSLYAPLYVVKRHADRGVRELETFIEAHYAETLTLERLAEQIHVSVRTLQRRFQGAAGMTPLQYQQMVRIERAKDLLEAQDDAVQAVAALVGYQDRVAFGRLFKKMTGLTPDAYRQRYRQPFPPAGRAPAPRESRE